MEKFDERKEVREMLVNFRRQRSLTQVRRKSSETKR